MFTSRARKRARLATLGFALAGILLPLLLPSGTPVSFWLVMFYVLLVVNAYFSIRCFGSFEGAEAPLQKTLDVLLALMYLGLPLQFTDAKKFMALSAAMFLVAAAKYTLLLSGGGSTRLLARKIFVDNLGTAVSLIMLLGAGTPNETSVLTFGVLATLAANVYILWLKPLYVLPSARA